MTDTNNSIVAEKLKKNKIEQTKIEESVASNFVAPTEEERKLVDKVLKKISSRFSDALVSEDMDAISDNIKNAIVEECSKLDLSYEVQKRIEKTVTMTALGNGPIEEFLQDDTVTEIVVQRYDNIVIERAGKIEKVDVKFTDENHLITIIKRIAQRINRQISLTKPILDARLKDGSRVNATIPPVSVDGATLTIRKFSDSFLSPSDYVENGSLSYNMLGFLSYCVASKVSMFVSGGTGTGKTTLLNMLSNYIPNDELIITIEDSCELKLQQENVRRMEARLSENKEMMNVDQQALVRAALRQRPDRIILGETRDGSIVDIISAMSTGHEGSMTTIHANSPRNMVDVRIPILYSMNKDADFDEKSIYMQFAEAVQLVVQIERFPDGSRKITHISHVNGILDGRVNLIDIFIYDKVQKLFYWTGYIPMDIMENMRFRGYEMNENYLSN